MGVGILDEALEILVEVQQHELGVELELNAQPKDVSMAKPRRWVGRVAE